MKSKDEIRKYMNIFDDKNQRRNLFEELEQNTFQNEEILTEDDAIMNTLKLSYDHCIQYREDISTLQTYAKRGGSTSVCREVIVSMSLLLKEIFEEFQLIRTHFGSGVNLIDQKPVSESADHSKIQELIRQHSDDSLVQQPGHVYQVWEDGEITIQKSGDLLGQRILHCIALGDESKAVPVELFPHKTSIGHGYIYTTHEGAEAVRAAILESDLDQPIKELKR